MKTANFRLVLCAQRRWYVHRVCGLSLNDEHALMAFSLQCTLLAKQEMINLQSKLRTCSSYLPLSDGNIRQQACNPSNTYVFRFARLPLFSCSLAGDLLNRRKYLSKISQKLPQLQYLIITFWIAVIRAILQKEKLSKSCHQQFFVDPNYRAIFRLKYPFRVNRPIAAGIFNIEISFVWGTESSRLGKRYSLMKHSRFYWTKAPPYKFYFLGLIKIDYLLQPFRPISKLCNELIFSIL